MTIRIDAEFRDAVGDVADLPIALPGGTGTIPLGSVADVAVRQGAGRVSREAGGRNVAIKANLLGRDQGSFVAEAMKKVNAKIKLPPGYYMTWGGQFENQQRALARLKVIVPLSVFSIFVLLFWVFGSMRRAILVLLMVPCTLGGAPVTMDRLFGLVKLGTTQSATRPVPCASADLSQGMWPVATACAR